MNTKIKTTTIAIALFIFFPTSTTADTYERDVTSISQNTHADQLEDGVNAYNQGDYTTAFRLLTPLADQGQPRAQNALGLMFDHGNGVSKNTTEALKWYRKSADQGYAKAETNLGYLYERYGEGAPQNYVEAANFFRKAADQGYALAQVELGYLYEHGQGVQQDIEQAAYWYRKAAEQGDANAQNNLGSLYFNNIRKTCGFNFACAFKQLAISEDLFRKAAGQGLLRGKLNLGIQLSSDMFKANEAKQLLKEVSNSNDPNLARIAVEEMNKLQSHEAAVEQNITESQRMSDEWAQQQQETLEFNQRILDAMDSK
jgi:uncharacterized protein